MWFQKNDIVQWLFYFQICKRRIKVLNSKSPASHGAKTPQKAYKHLHMVQFSSVKRVADVVDSTGNVTCLVPITTF